ncbi:hypothetical protein [Qipengyuania sp. ASV99]
MADLPDVLTFGQPFIASQFPQAAKAAPLVVQYGLDLQAGLPAAGT